jgi:hypothetical protein
MHTDSRWLAMSTQLQKLSLRDAENIIVPTVGITFDFVLSSVAHIPSHTVALPCYWGS